jgi:hypothetical protein
MFHPHSLYYYSFTALIQADRSRTEISFSQLARLIENIGYVGKIDDFTIKPLTQHSFLLAGFGLYNPSRLSHSETTMGTAVESMHNDTTGIQLQHSKAVDTRAIELHRGELSYSEDDGVLTESDPDLYNSDDDGSSTEDEEGRSNTRKHNAWLPLDEQRLLAYRKEGKSWSWIFRKFPGRTPGAVRTRCHMVLARLQERHGNKNDQGEADAAGEAMPKRQRGRPPKQK